MTYPKFTGQGVLFAVVDDYEDIPEGARGAQDVIELAIKEAFEQGLTEPHQLASFLTTTAFQHAREDKRVQFNAILRASLATGADVSRLLSTAVKDLHFQEFVSTDEEEAENFRIAKRGVAMAHAIAHHPFDVIKGDPLLNWERITELADDLFEELDEDFAVIEDYAKKAKKEEV